MRARDNPFRSARIDALAFRDPDARPADLLRRWHAQGRRGALVGPRGSGKTTLLGELISQLASGGERVVGLRLRADSPPGFAALGRLLAECGHDAVLCVDGLDLLGAARRVWLRSRLRGLRGVLVTAHAPCCLPTLHRTTTSARLLQSLAAELLGQDVAGLRPEIDRLFVRSGGDIRRALFALYAEAAGSGSLAADRAAVVSSPSFHQEGGASWPPGPISIA